MNHEITFSGFSAVPSDYECPDGDMAVAINLIPEDGAVKPVLPPKQVMTLQEGETVKFIHKTSAFQHYIIYAPETGCITSVDSTTHKRIAIDTITDVSHFNAVGNTLIAFTKTGFHYFLWKNNAYTHLGDHLPDIEVSFGLVGHPRLFSLSDDSKATFNISFNGIAEDGIYNELSEDNKTKITEQVMAKVNKFVRQQTVEKGRFCFPFFVRYALRLYDGSLTCHSAPILMNPSTKAAPIVWWNRVKGKKSYTEANCDIMLVAASLDYKVVRNADAYDLDDWKDIIKSIDVFISKPVYTYDQNGKISSFADTDNYNTKFIGRLYADNKDSVASAKAEDKLLGAFSSKDFLDYYCEWPYQWIYAMYYAADRRYPITTFHLPEFTEGKVAETLANTANFYKLCAIPVDEALADDKRKDITVDDEYLQSLVTREAMTDDYLSRDQLHADYSFAYNNRLNLAGLKRKPFEGFLAQSMFAYCNRRYRWLLSGTTIDVSISNMSTDSYDIAVYIRENGEEYAVKCGDYRAGGLQLFCSGDVTHTDGDGKQTTEKSKHSWGCYVFYPNANAYKMVVYNYSQPCFAFDLKPHDFLNGAYALIDYDLVREKNFSSLPAARPVENDMSFPIDIANKVYTSEVNNPFFFPLLGINTVGTGAIRGICSAAKALSQGQFGQFPLYAFTTEGVWALEVSANGTYSARQPITRDVCVNPEGITQLDSAVLFPTDRGIMIISGSQTKCISDAINSDCPFDATALQGFTTLHDRLGHLPASDKCLPTMPFSEFLKMCQMVYDYVQQRVIVYAPGVTYAYLYSLKSQRWGMMFSDIASHLNSYPEALAVNASNAVVNFSTPAQQQVKCLLLTRPIKLGAADVLKTVDSVILRGLFHKKAVATALYGSRDLIHWHLVWSSADHYLLGFRGSPYKFFRIAALAELSPGENVYGASIRFTPRQTGQLR